MLVSRMSMTGTLLINGRSVDGIRPSERLHHRHRYQPVFFRIPPSYLSAGDDRVHLAIASPKHPRGWVGAVYFGPAAIIQKMFEIEQRLSLLPGQIAIVLSATLSVLFFLLWLHDRRTVAYAYFGSCALAASLYLLGFVVLEPPLAEPLWTYFLLISLLLIVTMLPKTPTASHGEMATNIWMKLCGCVLVLITIALFTDLLLSLAPFITLGLQLMFCYVLVSGPISSVMGSLPLWTRSAVVSLCAIAMLQLAIYDFWGIRYGPLLISWAAISALLLFTWALLTEFINEFRATEVLNEKLNSAITQKSSELEAQYARVSEYERDKVLNQERDRIMRDMHDGVGGQLISALAMLEKGSTSAVHVRENLRDALADMRLVVDSLDPTINDAGMVLGALRQRLEPRLAHAGISLDWRTEHLAEFPLLGPVASLHLMRFVQEAITNVYKHAEATRLRVAAKLIDTGVVIQIIDNGVGLTSHTTENNTHASHRGLRNMQHRANALGGVLSIKNIAAERTLASDFQSGTIVQLELPLTETVEG